MTPVYLGSDVVFLEHIVSIEKLRDGYWINLSDKRKLLIDTLGPIEKALDGRKNEGWLWRPLETS